MAEKNPPDRTLLKLAKALEERRLAAINVDRALAKAMAVERLEECKRLVALARALLRSPRD